MKVNERLYPHPVQAHFSDDLIGCMFQVTPQVLPGKHAYKFSVVAKTSSIDLVELIKNHKARYALHIECATTRFRKLITSFEEEFHEEIPAERLEGRVEMCSFVIAAEDIENYKNRNFHPDYSGASFTVSKGDVLAVGLDRHFDANKDIDPLQNISSIFKVKVNHNNNEPVEIELLGENIVILLAQQNFDVYAELRGDADLHPILASMIILPAMIHVLEAIKADIEQEENSLVDRRWYRVIHRKLLDKGYKPDDPQMWEDESSLVLAQKLIGDPLTVALKALLDMGPDTDDQDSLE